MTARVCPACGAPLVQRADEDAWHFGRRVTCGNSCAARARGATPAAERLMRRVERQADGCWIFTGATTPNGYGTLGVGGRGEGNVLAHRLSYEIHIGPIPAGLHVDHTCAVRRCVNPAHLEAVTQAENNRRSVERRRRTA